MNASLLAGNVKEMAVLDFPYFLDNGAEADTLLDRPRDDQSHVYAADRHREQERPGTSRRPPPRRFCAIRRSKRLHSSARLRAGRSCVQCLTYGTTPRGMSRSGSTRASGVRAAATTARRRDELRDRSGARLMLRGSGA